ncbi:MAG: cytochrome P450 [Anaerolineales bacterium]|nr:cytochrome P450 [Anaerolineales bacterium]
MLTASGPDLRALLRDLPTLRDDPLGFFVDLERRYGPVARLPFGPGRFAFLLSDPGAIQHVLQDQARRYTKRTFQYTTLSLVTGQGLLTSDGPVWLRQRRLMQPAFHRERLTGFTASMNAAAAGLAERWSVAPDGQRVDVDRAMLALSLEIVGTTFFTTDLRADAPQLVSAVITALDHVIARSRNPFAPPIWLPTPAHRAFKRAVGALDDAVTRLIAERRAGPPRPDLLQMLLDTRDEDGRPMEPRLLRDELVTLIVAGHETVASALTWAWALLAQHPAAADRLALEADAAASAGSLDPRDLPFATAVFDEALRLYPPAWLITRQAAEDDDIEGLRVPAGSLVIVSPYVVQRRAALWPEPDRFRPERFLEAAPQRFAYLPFGAGPRLCIGQGFARLEGPLILANLARRVRLSTESALPAIEPLVTLRPHGGLHLHVTRRVASATPERSTSTL